MFDMLKQLKEMKTKIADFKHTIENASFFGQDISNKVRVKVSGKGALLEIDINEDCKGSSDLEGLILDAYNDAKSQADNFYDTEINRVTGGMPLPFDMKSFF